jgi:hypothetical protein
MEQMVEAHGSQLGPSASPVVQMSWSQVLPPLLLPLPLPLLLPLEPPPEHDPPQMVPTSLVQIASHAIVQQ